uniref:Uncharacterized protein n=1 Tax=Rhizophora mucronata TaxID=61149 RepID=A0A2P2PJL8_RHIMU
MFVGHTILWGTAVIRQITEFLNNLSNLNRSSLSFTGGIPKQGCSISELSLLNLHTRGNTFVCSSSTATFVFHARKTNGSLIADCFRNTNSSRMIDFRR